MTRAHWIRYAAFAGLAVLLLVIGAAMRPLVIAEEHPEPALMSELEIGFTQDMVAHHGQALLMAQRLDGAADPTVRALAQQIADSQRTELGMMLGWLRMAHAVTINPQPMAWMHEERPHAHEHSGATTATAAPTAAATMPGMATMDELDALAAARGVDAEVRFLRLMHRHHAGGIQMAQTADRLLASGIVKQAARDMFDTQTREAGLLGLLLTQRVPADAPR
ncbi:DUF305 domain-containing protein [Nocardia bovistercoris]|uniref:DUF305 domain-containing protein n=1 Tax=Nocardia bovistercoris TaxID=2785916 RepID=A0A931I8F0_9NOCA|nr:DUF305 domain-containing protein [Nocardia bovistercoris]MBH0776574.1 DUF305 domain-containing protein [Nocardia bovistercoris]